MGRVDQIFAGAVPTGSAARIHQGLQGGVYRQCPSDPFQAFLFIPAIFNPFKNKPEFAAAYAQLFGGPSAPLNWARVPDFCLWVAAILVCIALDYCVDD